jgi:PAS domain-containing protein
LEGSVEEGLGHLSVPAGALPAMFEPLRADRLVAGLLAAAAPQLPLPWLFAAPPGLARGVAGPDVPQAVADALVLAAPHLAARLPERPRGQSRSGADVVAAAGLSLAGVGPSFVTALAPRRGGSPGVLWLGGPPGLAVDPPDAAALLRIEELCAVVGAVAERTYRQGLLRWARRLLRPGGLLPRLAAEAPLARLLDTLCLSFEGLYPARWAIVPWVGDEAGLVYGPSLTAAERTALEGSARRLLLDGGHKRTAAGSPHRTLYREPAAVLESLGGHTAYPHTARNARGEIVASLLVLDAPREQLRHRDRIVLRTAANFAVLCLERQRLRRLHAASDARYRSLLDATSHLVWFLDAAGTIRHARGWHALTGHHVPETMEAWLCAVHPDERLAAVALARRYRLVGQARRHRAGG